MLLLPAKKQKQYLYLQQLYQPLANTSLARMDGKMYCCFTQRTATTANGKITERQIRLGIRSQGKAEILSGLKAGEKLVLQPQKNMKYINRRVKR